MYHPEGIYRIRSWIPLEQAGRIPFSSPRYIQISPRPVWPVACMIVHGFTEGWGFSLEITPAPGEQDAYPVVRPPLNKGLNVGRTRGIRGHEAVRAFVRAGGVVRQGKGDCGGNGVLKVEFTVMIRRAGEGGFWAEVPALPGCYSQGETIEETLENIREAIEGHMEALQQEGQGVPPEEDLIIGRVRVSESFA